MNGITACVTGRLGSDAELRYSAQGTAFAAFNLAVDDAKREEGAATEWVRCVLFGEQAEDLAPRLVKGVQVYIEGRLRLDQWEGRDGEQRATLKLAAWVVQPMGVEHRRPRQDGPPRGAGAPQPRRMPEAMAVGAGRNTRHELGLDDGDADGLPF